jgi:hypothetical protein
VALPVELPSIRVSIAGLVVPGAVSLEIETVAYFAAARFHLGFAIGAAPYTGLSYFAAMGSEMITIEASTGGTGFVTLMVGQIDNIQIDLLHNRAELSGRDLSARLLDAEISETFVNRTASQIAQDIAQRHQLSPNISPTTTPVGQYYEMDHARSMLGLNSRSTTDWNLLSTLAQLENFDLSVVGTTLNFTPSGTAPWVTLTPTNFISLSFDFVAALPASVTVKSWNTRRKIVVSEIQGTGISTTIIRPNLSAEQARQLAANHLATLRQHNTMLIGMMPGDLTMAPGTQLSLVGTRSLADRTYTVVHLCRTLNTGSGFLQKVRAFAAT